MSLAFRMTTECVLCEVGTEDYEATVDINVSSFTRQVQETILGKIQPLRSSPLLKNFSALLNYMITLLTNTCCYCGCENLVSTSNGRI